MQISNICPICKGTGIVAILGFEYSCVNCAGTGKMYSTIEGGTKLTYTFSIVAVINQAEYLALGETAKDILRIVLACGIVDLDHTGIIYTNLMTVFASSPISKAAIEIL